MLEVDKISAGYTDLPVIDRVSISVAEGKFVSIVGPNGAGKTTLFKTISGILKPMSGSIRFQDVDLATVPAARRPHLGIAHVPEGRQVFPSLTVMENLEMGAFTDAGRRNWKDNLERILTWLPVLADHRTQLAGTLSGGEQQMVAVGRGLASAPKLLMLDEPSMDLRRQSPIPSSRSCWKSGARHASPSCSSSNVSRGAGVADHSYVLEAGRVVLEGNNESLRADDRVRRAYLGM